jgi:hypothetical protein
MTYRGLGGWFLLMLNCRSHLIALCIALAAGLCPAQNAPDYRAQLVELIASAQPPGTNAWQDLADLAPALAQCRDEYLAAHQDVAEYAATLHDRDIGYDLLAAAHDRSAEADEIVRRHAPAYAALVAERLAPRIDSICSADRLVPPVSDVPLIEVAIPHMSALRSITRALVWQMRSAAAAGDRQGVTRSFERLLRLAQLTGRQARSIEYVTAVATEAQALDTLRDLMVARAVDQPALEAMRAPLENHTPAPLVLTVEGERSFGLDMIEYGFARAARQARPDATPEQQARLAAQLKSNGSFTAASAERQKAKLEEYYGKARVLASMPRLQRLASDVSIDEFNELPPQFTFVELALPALRKMLQSADQIAERRAGVRTLLAIELYKARHGDYPESLAALVPEFFETLPADPYSASGFVYRRVDAAADPHRRAYLLYSVGADREDNDGRADHGLGVRALSLPAGRGFDFVINEPGS